jgi:hypothetical protein
MRTTLDLPDAIFLQLKAESALRGLALKDLVTEFIQAGLQRANPVGEPRLRSPLPVIRKPRGVAHPALSNREIEELLTESDARGQS